MTEKEAKTKGCPHAHTITEPLPYGASRIKQTNDGKCISFGCMAWRWASERNPDWKPPTGYSIAVTQPHPDDVESPYRPSKTHGYCGLAGRP